MKHLISRRNFLKAAGVTTAAAAMAVGAPAASACWTGEKSEVTILYTNDVHTYIDKQAPELTYAAIAALKQSYQDAGKKVLLVDAGDHVQGTAYGSMDQGASIIELMNAAGYDAATPGNHEFDYGMDRAKELMRDADFPYLSCNWVDLRTNLRVLPEIKVFVRGGVRIAFVGITTPETFTKSTPAYFMNKAQTKYIYDILGGEDGQKLYSAVQKAVDKAKCLADVVIGLGHLGVDPSSSPWTSEEVIAHTTGFDAFIDGHSHTVMENKQVADASGRMVTLTQTGSYFANVGEMTIAPDGTISTRLVSTYDQEDVAVAAEQAAWVSSVDEMLGEKIAVADTKFYITDPATGKRRIRSGETNLGDFVADGIYTYFNEVEKLHCDIAIMNGGGIRSDEDAGYWTFKTCKQVSPFGNVACLMSVTGKQIQDALEFAARFAGAEGKENGGFLQVAGATYEIHTDIPNTVQTDDKNVWIGSATGTPRVQNVKIYDRANGTYVPLDENKTYALAGMNYTLRNLGDGFAMFDGAELIKDYVSEDYLVMSTYAMTFGGVDAEGLPHLSSANSVLAEYPGYLLDYENPYGAGRISIL
ncbi:bifunctional UDP-sugar hydrolase/5'-nucleotidase [uncultured Faecalibacterium sp.]|uniref:bifunctional metallophosphatase/5'-nucleotidase n=1 Tax=uncultured Faecalibacterium sp. TaxID=259315 RepID=UPI0026DB26BC|nr:bifunctional UDP-sugar hydrolase/5'-nucleotidase [uncultured Faecalibacterium sp.]